MNSKSTAVEAITLKDIIYIPNGKNSKVGTNHSPYLDDHFQYGLGFFETILVLEKGIFLDEHCRRLNNTLHHFHIPRFLDPSVLASFITTNNLHNIGLKILVTETIVVASTRALTYTDSYYDIGANVALSNIIKSSHSLLVRHKSTNYGDNILTLRQIHQDGYNDCLFTNEFGHLTESCIGNLFIIKDERLITPPLSDGLLPGIVRDYFINNYDVLELPITVDDLRQCNGAFLTNSLVGMINITHFLEQPIPIHPTQRLMRTNYTTYISTQ